jgi:GntR family transcriptional regulator/MocR family aminotransferase
MRQLYGERRDALIKSIRDEFGETLQVHGANAGTHLTVTLPDGFRDQQITAMAANQRLWLLGLSPCYLGKMARQGFVLGFGSTPADQMPQAVRHLRSVIGNC